MNLLTIFILVFCTKYSYAFSSNVGSILQYSILKASVNSTIYLNEGEYSGIIVNKPVRILGAGKTKSRIKNAFKKNVILILASNTILKGLEISESGASDVEEYAGIKIENARNCTIKNNVIFKTTFGIYLSKAQFCFIKENLIGVTNGRHEGTTGNAIHLWSSTNIEIIKNIISRYRDGIYIEFSINSLVKENFVVNNMRYGLHFMYSHGSHYVNNRFLNNMTGVAVMYSKNISMIHNAFQQSKGKASYGLLLKEISDSYIGNNYFRENTVGVLLDGSNRNNFINNIFYENGWGINILGNSETNILIQNKFLSNMFNATTNGLMHGKIVRNMFVYNFWGDYQGYDLNKNQIGDIEFRPMKMFEKWMTQYPELLVLFGSPVIQFLELAESILPILTPPVFSDTLPLMRLF